MNSEEIRVLHVEDEQALAELVAEMLHREHNLFSVETVPNASEGLERLEADSYDCIVSDYDMPGQNGIEFLENLREEYPDLPFILYTGKGSEEIASEAISAGVTDYLQKQNSTEQYELLANRIQNVVSARRDAKEAKRRKDLMKRTEVLGATGGWELRVESEEIRLTEGIKQIYGVETGRNLSIEEAIGFYEPDAQRKIRSIISHTIEEGYGEVDNLHLQTTNGGRRIVEGHAELVENDGDSTVLRGVIRDITDEKTRERQLKELNQATQALQTAETKQEVADLGVEAASDVLDIPANAIHLSDAGDTRLVPAAQNDELTSLIGDAPSLPMADSIAGRVYRDGETTVIRDVTQEPNVYNSETYLKTHLYLPLADHGILIAGSKYQVANDKHDTAFGELLAGTLVAAFDRVEREQNLRQRKLELSLLFEESPLGTIQWDDEFHFERLNKRAEAILGYDEPELRGESWETIVAPNDQDKIGAVVEDLLNADGGTHARNRNVRKDGEIITSEWHNRVVTDTNGDVLSMFSHFQDVTNREDRKRELEEYETIIEALTDAVYVLDEEGQFTYVNDEFVELVGYDRETILGSKPSLIKAEDAVKRAEQELGRLLSRDGPNTVQFEVTIQPRDGNSIICEDHMGILPYEGDHFDGSVGTLRDITDHKERKQELKARTVELEELTTELEAQYRQLFEEAPVMAVVTRIDDDRPIIEDCNQLFAETVGYEESEVIGEELASFYTQESKKKLLDNGGYERALTGDFVRENRELVTANNETVETLLRAIPWQDVSADTSGVISLYIDISKRKKLERENSRLEEFTAIVSHDLRNPLRIANGRLELAQEDCKSEHLEPIADALDRMDRIIEDLLWLAHENREIGSVEPVVITDIMEETWCFVSGDVIQAECHYVDDNRGDSVIMADKDRVKQLLENLFTNALQHCGEDVTVTVGVTEEGFYIEDDGPGIPTEEHNDVFDAGYSNAEDGIGLGLHVVNQVANAHDWNITITEGTTGGTRFEITGVTFAEN
jgi:PAS domain S-box-containing protein